jgi:hypothetical protein
MNRNNSPNQSANDHLYMLLHITPKTDSLAAAGARTPGCLVDNAALHDA